MYGMDYGAQANLNPSYGSLTTYNGYDNVPSEKALLNRGYLDYVPICFCVIVPCGIFAGMCSAVIFSVQNANFIVAIGFIVVLFLALKPISEHRRKNRNKRVPTWSIFLFATSALAWLIGVIYGSIFAISSYPDLTGRDIYLSIDPDNTEGRKLMDAGRIMFTPGSHLDTSKSMGFKNSNMYCVAPVIGAGNSTRSLHDIWAVGVNCCSGGAADFHCGDYNDPKAVAGLRFLDDSQHAYFRLAVQQAEAAYHIRAQHPIFVHWTRDPFALEKANKEKARMHFILGLCSFCAFQIFLVASAALVFAKNQASIHFSEL